MRLQKSAAGPTFVACCSSVCASACPPGRALSNRACISRREPATNWIHEIKHDGYRLMAAIIQTELKLRRNSWRSAPSFPLFCFGALAIKLTRGALADRLRRPAPSARPLDRAVDQNRHQQHWTYDLHDGEQRHRLYGVEHVFSPVGAASGRLGQFLDQLPVPNARSPRHARSTQG